eukprot:m.181126 g.181126  ORF g.181126 m.181126 type:complete len:130 (+) comp39266_c0_seq1:868-1257(+)
MATKSLSARIYQHLTTAFSTAGEGKSELLSVPLCLTHASRWSVELYPVSMLQSMGFKIRHEYLKEDLTALETLLIIDRRSAWPYGCNLSIDLSSVANQSARRLLEKKSTGELPDSFLLYRNYECSVSFL